MASIERTAYPRFRRQVSARELRDVYTPSPDEIEWAQGLTRSDQHLLLKCFQRLGYFPRLEDVPRAVVEHARDGLGLAEEVPISRDADRTTRYHKRLVRDQLGVTAEPERARSIAEETIRSAAAVKDNPADLINVALEELIRARCELPAYSATSLRHQAATVLEAGVDLATVQKMAGHASVSTTGRYDRRGHAAQRKAASELQVPYVVPEH